MSGSPTLSERDLLLAVEKDDEQDKKETARPPHEAGELRFYVRCGLCFRSSPIVLGDARHVVQWIVDLGWKTQPPAGDSDPAAWTCPVCQKRDAGRYALR